MPSENGVPTSAVAPERSKIAPTLMSAFVEALLLLVFEAFLFLLSLPQPTPTISARLRTNASFLAERFIGFLLGVVWGSGSSVSKRPDPEVVLGPLPEPGETAGLEQQEDHGDDQQQPVPPEVAVEGVTADLRCVGGNAEMALGEPGPVPEPVVEDGLGGERGDGEVQTLHA